MSGVLRLSNSVTGRSTIIASASNDQTFTLPALGGTLLAGGSSLEVIFPSGSEALPGLHVQGDTDTGLYAPAANTLGISTAGSERLRIDSLGNVGIGTSSPGANLELGTVGGSDQTIRINSGGNGYLELFADGSHNKLISGNAASGSSSLSFETSSGGTENERMRIDSSGNVGIGTSSPGRTLDVNGVIRSDGTSGALAFGGNSSTPSEGAAIHRPANNTLAFATKSIERLRIDSDGNVGISISDPLTRLDLGAEQSGSTTSRITSKYQLAMQTSDASSAISHNIGFYLSGNDNVVAAIDTVEDGGNGSTGLIFATSSNSSSAPGERLRIDSSGNVGIGTTAIDFGDFGSNTGGVAIEDIGGTNTGLKIGDGSNDNYLIAAGNGNFYQSHYGPGSIIFGVGNGTGTERMRIDSSGRLLVGTSSSRNSVSYIQSYRAGQNHHWIESGNLANGEYCMYRAKANNSGGGSRSAYLGLFKNTANTNSAAFIFLDAEDGDNNYYWVDNVRNFRTSSATGHIGTTAGTVVGTQTSDRRLKNVKDTFSYGLAEVLKLNPREYALIKQPDTNKLGFVAQEVESIIPEAVFDTLEEFEGHQEGDRTKLGMEYVQLIPVLVNAIKELSSEVETLKQRLTDTGIA